VCKSGKDFPSQHTLHEVLTPSIRHASSAPALLRLCSMLRARPRTCPPPLMVSRRKPSSATYKCCAQARRGTRPRCRRRAATPSASRLRARAQPPRQPRLRQATSAAVSASGVLLYEYEWRSLQVVAPGRRRRRCEREQQHGREREQRLSSGRGRGRGRGRGGGAAAWRRHCAASAAVAPRRRGNGRSADASSLPSLPGVYHIDSASAHGNPALPKLHPVS